MKLNRECMNEIMLFLEKNLAYPQSMEYTEISERLYPDKKTSQGDIYYSLKKLGELGYIEVQSPAAGESAVLDITMDGHDFIKQLKDRKNFNI